VLPRWMTDAAVPAKVVIVTPAMLRTAGIVCDKNRPRLVHCDRLWTQVLPKSEVFRSAGVIAKPSQRQ